MRAIGSTIRRKEKVVLGVHSLGVETYPNGDKYTGDFKDDKKSGKGLMEYNDGDTYEGDWANDLRNGKGTLTHPNGEKAVLQWKDDKPIEEGKSIDN